jgi:hypothetical protein
MARHRFTPTHSNRELMDLLAAVARVANPENPDACTQRAFDAARSDAGHPDCPTAQQICTRLNAGRTARRSWRAWLGIVLNESDDYLNRSAGKQGTVKQSPEQIQKAAAFALRLARNEGDHHLSRRAYEAWREARVADIDERLRYVFPTGNQIMTAYGSWKEAVQAVVAAWVNGV